MTRVVKALLWAMLILALIAAAVCLAVVISCEIALHGDRRREAVRFIRSRRDSIRRW